jgi:signal transduction histidine kinase
MRTLRDIPIRQKLMVIVMLTTVTAMLLSGIGMVAADSILFRRNLERDLSTQAQIIADTTTGELAFNDPKSADETLGALRSRTHVVAACIYRPDGTTLANYTRAGADSGCPPGAGRDELRFRSNDIIVSRVIFLSGHPIGTLVLLYDLLELSERMRIYGATVIGVLLVSSLIAFLLSSSLRAIIATPVSQLVRAMTSVSETSDYSIRAPKLSNDELGLLADRFNEMLAGIQLRDDSLKTVLGEREAALRELRRANEDLQQFAYSASHDLQEPIRNVAVYSEIVAKRYMHVLDADGKQFLGFLAEGGRRLARLISDLLSYTRAGIVETDATPVDASAVLEQTLSGLAEAIRESGAHVTRGRLPRVWIAEAHLQQVFQNLITNALKYRKETPPEIHISAVHQDAAWCFSVQDNGIGIDPQYKEKIFGVFKRLHRDQKYSGTGIGLAICHRVLELYGGRIWVESSAGEGATFFFTVPQRKPQAKSATADSSIG